MKRSIFIVAILIFNNAYSQSTTNNKLVEVYGEKITNKLLQNNQNKQIYFDVILNNSFEGALSVEDNNPTNFIAFKKNKKINAGELMFVSSFGTTDVNNNNNSLIRNIDDIYTSSFAINYSKPNILFKNS